MLLSLGETGHLKGRDMVTAWRTVLLLSCYDCDSTRQHYDVTRFEYALWHPTMHEWVMNIHYQTWIAQGRFINIIRTPSKQWGVCDNLLKSLSRLGRKQRSTLLYHLWGESIAEFISSRVSNSESVSMLWHQHERKEWFHGPRRENI